MYKISFRRRWFHSCALALAISIPLTSHAESRPRMIRPLVATSPTATLENAIQHLEMLNHQHTTNYGDATSITHSFGGVRTDGGLTRVDTSPILTSAVKSALLAEFRRVVVKIPGSAQHAYNVSVDGPNDSVLARFVRSHMQLSLGVINKSDPNWRWTTSSLLLLNQRLQTVFHDHVQSNYSSTPKSWAVVTIGDRGTVFMSLAGQILETGASETVVFNERTLHMSPEMGATSNDRLYLMHYLSK